MDLCSHLTPSCPKVSHHWPGINKDAQLIVQELALDSCLIMGIISKLTLLNVNSIFVVQNDFSRRST